MLPARTFVCGCVLFAFLAQIPFSASTELQNPDPEGVSAGPRRFEVEEHEGIFIDEDGDFTFDNGVVNGSGTVIDPYIISGWDINTSATTGIIIVNTRASFMVRDCYIHGNHSRSGIVLGNVTGGRIEANFICDNTDGIECDDGYGNEGVSFCNFTNNSIVSNKNRGLWFEHILYQHIGNNISSNNISDNGFGISAIVFKDNLITGNLISFNKGCAVTIGMCTGGGGGNLVDYNNFISNNNGSKQAVDEGDMEGLRSLWNDSRQGNFWSDWTGPDSNGDGVIDKPYKIKYGIYDYYPLVNPVEGIEYQPAPPDRILAAPDRKPPGIFDLTPANSSLADSPRPVISANFSDGSGIDLLNSSLVLDGVDITRNATWTCGSVRFEPSDPMSGTVHTVEFAVTDNSTLHNQAYARWSFTAPDGIPPRIFDLQPPDCSVIDYSTPIISANFSDESGIYPPGVFLYVDSMDVTGHTWYTTKYIEYRPLEPLANGVHRIRLTLADGSVDYNLAIVLWNFTVEVPPVPAIDRAPPEISGLWPANLSRITDTRPFIAANYTDGSGMDIESIRLILDGKDVTWNSVRTSGRILYHPPAPLAREEHSIQLIARDISTERNLAEVRWNFTIVAQEPEQPIRVVNQWGDRNLGFWSTLMGAVIGITLAVILYIKYKRRR
jgi:hypothetical protein